MLEQAISLHREGQFAEAERLYREILRQEPENAQVGHMLGQLGMDAGVPDGALPVLERVRMLDPGNAGVHNDIGKCLHMTGRMEEAVASFDRAILLAPGLIEAHTNRGLSLRALGRTQQAVEAFEQALALDPESPATLSNSAVALGWLERYEDALARLDSAVAKGPDDPALYYNRAEVSKMLRRHDAALADYDRALALAPDYAEVHFNRGLLLVQLGRFEDGLAALDRALVLTPQDARLHVARGLSLARLERFADALESLDRAVAASPDFSDGHIARCLVLARMGRVEDAIAHARELARRPAFKSDAEFNLAPLLLQRGEWEEGWRLYEARKTCSLPTESRPYAQPVWLGQAALQGKTLYVYAEQGLGDTIQFCRYLLQAKAQGARVIFSAQDRLVRLVSSLDADIEVLPHHGVPAQFDYHAPLLSLPLAFAITPQNAAPVIPYLHAEKLLTEKWRERIGAKGFKIGICWTGNIVTSNFDFGLERSFPLNQLAALAGLPGVRLISLQKDNTDALAGLPAGMAVETLGAEFDAGTDGFIDTAAAMQAMDLIITCDTAVAHLAGALGRPAWLALNDRPEWRWLLGRSDTPWYPTMTLFRQMAPGDWRSVFAAMQGRLAGMLRG